MNKWILSLIIVLYAIAFFFGYYLYLQNTRYELQGAGRGAAYKIDRRAGKVWLITPSKQREIIEMR